MTLLKCLHSLPTLLMFCLFQEEISVIVHPVHSSLLVGISLLDSLWESTFQMYSYYL